MRSILVVRAGALGDALLTLPALAALRTRWPAARLTLVAPRALLPFVLASGLADAALPFEGEAGLALNQDEIHLPPWARADLAMVWLRAWEPMAARLARSGPATVLGAPSVPPEESPVHVADHLLATLTPLGIGRSRLARPLQPPMSAATAARRRFPPLATGTPPIAIHPGSGGLAKCWPEERYRRLIEWLTERGSPILLCLGPAEHEQAAAWRAFATERRGVWVVSNLDLPALAALLQRCAAYVGNDAGVTHLAAALGVPTLALFGPTDPARWAPLGPRTRVLRDPAWIAGARPGGATWSLSAEAVAQNIMSTW